MPTREDTINVSLKGATAQVEGWEAAAEECGMARQAWCKAVLDAGAGLPLREHLAAASVAGAKLRSASKRRSNS